MIEVAFRALLTDAALCPTVVALVGSRVHANKAPQNTPYPLVVFHVTYGASRPVMEGGFDGMRMARLQVDCQAQTDAEAIQLAEAVLAEAGAFRGRVGGSPGYSIKGIFHLGEGGDPGTDMLNAGPGIGLKRIEFEIFLRR